MSISIVFENDDFLVVNKPSGIVVHDFDYGEEKTLLDFIAEICPSVLSIKKDKKLQDGRIINLGGLVHKLDRDTSGVMVIAKNEKAFFELSFLFKNHHIEKQYVALVDGVVKEDNFIINASLGRNKKEYKQVAYPSNPRGVLRDAKTEVKVLKRNKTTTLVELIPKTGRTHQLRAHMAYIGHPIVGDKAYGSKQESSRIMLHAKMLSFTLFGIDHSFTVPVDF